MSSHDQTRPPGRPLALAAALLAALVISGCNVRPLHAPPDARTDSVGTVLAAVDIDPVQGRAGQQIRNELEFLLRGGGEGPAGRYTLRLTVDESLGRILVRQISGQPQGRTATVRARYELRAPGSDRPLFRGSITRTAPFEWSRQRFANDRAEIDAVNRAAADIAIEIRNRLAGYFASDGAMGASESPEVPEENDIDRAMQNMRPPQGSLPNE